jgi:putative DNA primase/helicase
LREAALAYARRGVPVFALQPGRKEPATPRGFYDATTDSEMIRRWWTRMPLANIGIPTGEASGILVLDVDPDRGGRESLASLEREIGELPCTYRVQTGGGGEHIYFRYPGERVGCSAGLLGPGLDIRGEGGYIVGPPSRTTGPYTILERSALADTPPALLERLRGSRRARSNPSSTRKEISTSAAADLESGEIFEGSRNARLTQIAGQLRARGAGDAVLGERLDEINAARCAPPLPAAEVRKIAANAARWPAGTVRQIDRQTAAALEDTRRGVIAHPELWRGMGGKSARDFLISLIGFAERHGGDIPAGVRVEASFRQTAEKAAIGVGSSHRAFLRLRALGILRKDDADRSREQGGAFVILPRANWNTLTPGEAIATNGVGGVPPCAHPPFTAPRLRWSAPQFEGGERVGTVHRLGKSAGAVADVLEHYGTLSLADLAFAVGVKRPRDLRRRALERLIAAGVVEETGADLFALARDWRDALERERERSGEIDAARRQIRAHNEARQKRRYWRGDAAPEVDPAPTSAELQDRRESAPERRREAIESGLVRLFRDRPEYRTRRPGQIVCALTMWDLVPEPLTRGVAPGGPPRDSEVLKILEENGASEVSA